MAVHCRELKDLEGKYIVVTRRIWALELSLHPLTWAFS